MLATSGNDASSVAASACSRLRRARPGRPYLKAIVSPCSVMRRRAAPWGGGCARIARCVGPPPRPVLPPRPWKTVSPTSFAAATSPSPTSASWIAHWAARKPPSLAESEYPTITVISRPRSSSLRASVGACSSSSRIPGAFARSAIVSNSGATEMSQPAASASAYVASTSSALAVPDSTTVSSASRPCLSWAARTAASVARSPSSGARTCSAWTRTSSRAMCSPNTATRRRSAASRPSAMRAPTWCRRLASTRARSAASSAARGYPGSSRPASSLSSRRQIAVSLRRYGSWRFRTAVSSYTHGSSRSSCCDRGPQLVVDIHERVRDADRAGELAHLVAVAPKRERAGATEGVGDLVRSRVRVAILVAADPRAELEGKRVEPGQLLIEQRDEVCRDVEQARLEEPQSLADLVVDARADRAHLVGLP